MNVIERIDASTHSFDSYPDLSIQARKRKPGPPEGIACMTVGIVEMAKDAPLEAKFTRMATKSSM